MRVLGIDPGLDTTGWALVCREGSRLRPLAYGVIRTRARDALEQRLAHLHAGVSAVLREQRPDAVALEELYSAYAHPRTAILMGHARGVVCLCAAQQELPLFHYNATQVKRALTGSGRASKEQVQGMVGTLLGLDLSAHPSDVADALALAVCHCNIVSPRSAPEAQSAGANLQARKQSATWLRRRR